MSNAQLSHTNENLPSHGCNPSLFRLVSYILWKTSAQHESSRGKIRDSLGQYFHPLCCINWSNAAKPSHECLGPSLLIDSWQFLHQVWLHPGNGQESVFVSSRSVLSTKADRLHLGQWRTTENWAISISTHISYCCSVIPICWIRLFVIAEIRSEYPPKKTCKIYVPLGLPWLSTMQTGQKIGKQCSSIFPPT